MPLKGCWMANTVVILPLIKQTKLPLLGAIGCLLVTLLGAVFFFSAANVNYPGGEAFKFLHEYAQNESHVVRSVHIDVPAAMTGVSRFGEEFSTWRYEAQVHTSKQL